MLLGPGAWPPEMEGPTGPRPCPGQALVGRAGAGVGAGPYLEVGAVVVVSVHHLPLAAAAGQHRDHLPACQVRVEL